jgi:hypothetical protein
LKANYRKTIKMASRKSSNFKAAVGLSPIPSASGGGALRGNMAMIMKQKQQHQHQQLQQQQQAGYSKAYLQAVQTLNESSMRQACELLLSQMHGVPMEESNGNDKEGGKPDTDIVQLSSVSQQLQDMYFKAEDALQVVRTHQPILSSSNSNNNVVNVPSLSGPAGRILPRTGNLHSTITPMNKPTSLAQLAKPVAGHSLKSGVFPIRRTVKPSMHHHKQSHHQHYLPITPMAAQLNNNKRNINDLRGNAISGGMPPPPRTKNPRLSPLPTKFSLLQSSSLSSPSDTTAPTVASSTSSSLSSFSSTSNMAMAPPPSALSFLAKLNKKSNKKKAATTLPPQGPPAEEYEDNNEEEDEEEGEDNAEQDDDDDDEKEMDCEETGTVDELNRSSQRLGRRKNPSRGFHPNRK